MHKKPGILYLTVQAILLLPVLLSCSGSKHQTAGIVRAHISLIIPYTFEKSKPMFDTFEVYVSYKDHNRIYEIPKRILSENEAGQIRDTTIFRFFICNEKDNFGFFLENKSSVFGPAVNKDSMMAKYAFNGGDGKMRTGKKDSSVISEGVVFEEGSKMVYRYLYKSSTYDSALFCYDSNLKNIPFSISSSLDSTFNSKLWKMELFIKHDNNIDTELELKRYFITTHKIENAPSSDEYLSVLFDRFKHFRKTYSK